LSILYLYLTPILQNDQAGRTACAPGGPARKRDRAAFEAALSCALYLLLTRRVGTPFLDSLTEPQRQIKAASAKVRRDAFATTVAMSVAAVAVLKPFRPTQ
jgi:hypothetical protein